MRPAFVYGLENPCATLFLCPAVKAGHSHPAQCRRFPARRRRARSHPRAHTLSFFRVRPSPAGAAAPPQPCFSAPVLSVRSQNGSFHPVPPDRQGAGAAFFEWMYKDALRLPDRRQNRATAKLQRNFASCVGCACKFQSHTASMLPHLRRLPPCLARFAAVCQFVCNLKDALRLPLNFSPAKCYNININQAGVS